jgi:N-acetylneuraminic acid mutarotase
VERNQKIRRIGARGDQSHSQLKSVELVDRARESIGRDRLEPDYTRQKQGGGPVNSGAIVTARRLITVAIVFVTVAISAITSMDAASAADLTAWNAKTSMSTPRYGHSVATGVDGAIYVFGGTNSVDAALASVERYDTATNTWSARAPMPSARSRTRAVAANNGKIYVFGGHPPGCCATLSTVEEYDPLTNTWATKNNAPIAAMGVAGAPGPDGKLYFFGGYPGCCFGYLNSTYAYDPATDTWQTRASMPTPREGGGAALAANNQIYVAGGNGTGPIGKTVEAYDPASNTWTTKAPLPVSASYLALVAAPNGRLYAVGLDNSSSGSVYEYDPAANTWTAVTSLNVPRDFLGASVAANGRIYTVGGRVLSDSAQAGTTNEEGFFGQPGFVFSGFEQPIDNSAINIARAGQTVPVKWRLLDSDGNPVSDPASFTGLTTSPTSAGCSSGPSDVIEQYSGGSGLQYLGDGKWQYNWKTPKSYAAQCRTMSVKFSDGSSHEAMFQFK